MFRLKDVRWIIWNFMCLSENWCLIRELRSVVFLAPNNPHRGLYHVRKLRLELYLEVTIPCHTWILYLITLNNKTASSVSYLHCRAVFKSRSSAVSKNKGFPHERAGKRTAWWGYHQWLLHYDFQWQNTSAIITVIVYLIYEEQGKRNHLA